MASAEKERAIAEAASEEALRLAEEQRGEALTQELAALQGRCAALEEECDTLAQEDSQTLDRAEAEREAVT